MNEFNGFNDFEDTKNNLNKIGCGFCLAKWSQVTIHLQMGHTHSCHHPNTHKIPLDELLDNPSALHNTNFKKRIRKDMLEGRKPSECQYCWNVEKTSDQYSDRIYKSSDTWSYPDFEKIKNTKWDDNFNPRYVEVSFSNICNFKCSYCSPSYSSRWVQEIEEHGAYMLNSEYNGVEYLKNVDKLPFKINDNNPYVDSFWKWWPELYRNLHTFRITGGEPLLSKDTWNILDYILKEKNPNQELHLAINTNLGVPDNLIDDLIKKINNITNGEKVKDFIIFTSVDGWGEQAEYGRHGLIFNKFWDNINKILYKCPSVSIGIMSTYNVFSIPSYNKLIDEVYKLKKEYSSMNRYWTTPVSLDTSYLRYPAHQTVRIISDDFFNDIKQQSEHAISLREEFQVGPNKNDVNYGFTDIECDKILRIFDWVSSPINENELNTNRKNFVTFVNEHDRRRGTNFLKTFPEYENFYNLCKRI